MRHGACVAGFLLFLLMLSCGGKAASIQLPDDLKNAPVYRDSFLQFELSPPGEMERISTPEENTTVFAVDRQRKISFIRRHTSLSFEEFLHDFETRVLAPQFASGLVRPYGLGEIYYAEPQARLYGIESIPREGQEGDLSLILVAQKGKTFLLTAYEKFGLDDLGTYRSAAVRIAGTFRMDDSARLLTDAEVDALKACKLIVRMGFGGIRRGTARLFQTCSALNPYFDSYYIYWAEALRLGGEEEASIAPLEQGAGLFPGNATLINNQAWYLLTFADKSLRDYGRALALAEKAVELSDRQSASILHTLAQAYLETGDAVRAMEILEECRKLGPMDRETEKAVRELELRIFRMRT